MGLLRAGIGAAAGVLADQWREYFYCESIPADVLLTKAEKKVVSAASIKKAATISSAMARLLRSMKDKQ